MANTFIFDDDEQPDMGMSPTPEQDDDQPEEGEGSNRTFLLILGGIGVLFLLSVLCVGGYFLLRPGGPLNQASLSSAGTATLQVLASPTLAEVQASETPVATEEATATPVIVAFATDTALVSDLPTDDPATATLQAQLTELAALQQSQTTATVTSLPKATAPAKGGSSSSGGVGSTPTAKIPQTGFADEVALPIMGVMTVLLLGIIFLARRLRTSPGR